MGEMRSSCTSPTIAEWITSKASCQTHFDCTQKRTVRLSGLYPFDNQPRYRTDVRLLEGVKRIQAEDPPRPSQAAGNVTVYLPARFEKRRSSPVRLKRSTSKKT